MRCVSRLLANFGRTITEREAILTESGLGVSGEIHLEVARTGDLPASAEAGYGGAKTEGNGEARKSEKADGSGQKGARRLLG